MEDKKQKDSLLAINTLDEFKAYYKTNLDEDETLEAERAINLATSALIAENNTDRDFMDEWIADLVIDSDVQKIKLAHLILVNYYFENGADKQAGSMSLSGGSLNVAVSQDGTNDLPDNFYALYSKTPYYVSEILFFAGSTSSGTTPTPTGGTEFKTGQEVSNVSIETFTEDEKPVPVLLSKKVIEAKVNELVSNQTEKDNAQDIEIAKKVNSVDQIATDAAQDAEIAKKVNKLDQEIIDAEQDARILIMEGQINSVAKKAIFTTNDGTIASTAELPFNFTENTNEFTGIEFTAPNQFIHTKPYSNLLFTLSANVDVSSTKTFTIRLYKNGIVIPEATKTLTINDSGAETLYHNMDVEVGAVYTATYQVNNIAGGVSVTNATLLINGSEPAAEVNLTGYVQKLECENLIPIGGIMLSPTQPQFLDWTFADRGVIPIGAALIGGNMSEVSNGAVKAHNHQWKVAKAATAGAQGNNSWLEAYRTTFDINGNQFTEGGGKSNDSGEWNHDGYTNFGSVGIDNDYNKAYGIGIGTAIHIWERVS